MEQEPASLVFRERIFIWTGLVTGLILLIPLVAMQFTTEVNWDLADFIGMGSLLFGIVSLFVLAARRARRKRRLLIGLMFGAAFLYTWAELAVGVLTNLGS